MINLVSIQLSDHGRLYQCEDPNLCLSIADPCIVEKQFAEIAFGHMASNYMRIPRETFKKDPWKVLRKATDKDLNLQERNERREREAISYCKELVSTHNLSMKLEQVSFAFDAKKATFYYTAEEWIDFRQLVRDLAKEFKVRIEMRQIGARDLASLMGGCDTCGEQLCCTRNLKDLKPVPIRAAKDQNFTGNPDKLTGVCGRLKCCLLYEHPMYTAVKGSMPSPGKTVRLPEGKGRVAKIDVVREEVLVILEDGSQVAVRGDRATDLTFPNGPTDG